MPSYALAVALGSKMSLRSFKSNQEDTLNIDVYRQLGFEIKVLARQKHLFQGAILCHAEFGSGSTFLQVLDAAPTKV